MSRQSRVPLLLLVVLLLAAWLRFHNIEVQSFWNDEGNSARIAERPVSDIIAGAGGDIHPPAYYLMLAGWRVLAGHSEFVLRLFSALAGVLTAAVIYAIGAVLFDRLSGIVAALFAAISPFQVYYGQEARMYAPVALLVALSIWLTIKVLTLPGKMIARRFDRSEAAAIAGGFVLVNTLGLYTHYSFPLVMLVESLIFVMWLVRRVMNSRKRDSRLSPVKTLAHGLRVWGMLNILPVILFAPWIPTALRQISAWPPGGGTGIDAAGLASTLAYGRTLTPDAARDGLIPLMLLVLVGLFPPIDDELEQRHYLRFWERGGLIAAWMIVPMFVMAAMGAISEPALKFLLPSNLALMLLAARGVVFGFELSRPVPGSSMVNGWFIRLTIVVLVFFAALPLITSLRNLYTDPAYARDNYRAIAGRILAEAGPDAAVILNAPNQWEVFTYYYPDGPNVVPLPDDDTEEIIAQMLIDNRRIYVLYWGAEQQDPDAIVQHTLEQQALEASSEWYGGVRLATYAVTGGLAQTMDVPVGGSYGSTTEITLDGYTLSASALHPGDGFGVTLFWHADEAIGTRLKVFVHLIGPDGQIVTQHDAEPANFARPTDTWQPGETVIDAHGLIVPGDTPPGNYSIVVGMYRIDDGTRLTVSLTEEPVGDSLPVAEITIE